MELTPLLLKKIVDTASQAAILAGKKAVEELTHVTSSLKNPTEVVTQADPLCQDIIIQYIRNVFPTHGILAEEGPNAAMLIEAPRDNSDIWWIIDPIDGTNNYAHGLLCFCVSIGVIQNGSPVAGVIYDPCTDSLYTAASGLQTTCNGKPVSVSHDKISKISSFAFDSHFDPSVEPAVHQMLRLTRARSVGSTALHLAYLAKGAIIGTFTVSARLWDIAAGVILIQQAGGIVTTLDRQAVFPIDIGNYHSERFRLLAANPEIYSDLARIFETTHS
ncbi:inositol monophosphatase family protein [Anaerohalosphaeraceae bacterium U12dextr]